MEEKTTENVFCDINIAKDISYLLNTLAYLRITPKYYTLIHAHVQILS